MSSNARRVEQIGARRPVLATIDSLSLVANLDPYLGLRALAGYSGMSVRWLRAQLEELQHPLPHYKLAGKILVRRSEYDAWILVYRRAGRQDVTAIVNEVLRDLR